MTDLDDTLAFDITARGCRVTANYHRSNNPDATCPDATVRFYVGEKLVRQVEYPAYRIWNIAAHFELDLVPDLLALDGAA